MGTLDDRYWGDSHGHRHPSGPPSVLLATEVAAQGLAARGARVGERPRYPLSFDRRSIDSIARELPISSKLPSPSAGSCAESLSFDRRPTPGHRRDSRFRPSASPTRSRSAAPSVGTLPSLLAAMAHPNHVGPDPEKPRQRRLSTFVEAASVTERPREHLGCHIRREFVSAAAAHIAIDRRPLDE